VGPLTYEHLPPEAAFNDGPVYEADVEALLAAENTRALADVRRRKNQRGAGGYTLCSRCNNNTGSWYGPAYVEWALQGWNNITSYPGYVYGRPFEIEPLAVFKQVIAMFASSCGPHFFTAHPALRRFILNREEQGFPHEMRVFAYYVQPESRAARQSGIISSLDFSDEKQIRVFAEIAYPPYGYVLTLSGSPPPDSRIVDISFMANAAWGETRTLHLPLPSLRVDGYLPADYRTGAELDALLDRGVS
jgi:hypothetical protein